MRNIRELAVAGAVLLILTLSSCAMKQEVSIGRSGGGRVSFDINLASYLTDVIDQVTMLIHPEEPIPGTEGSFFDLPAIEEDFRRRDGLDLVRLETPNKNRLLGEFTFSHINLLIQDVEEGSAEGRLIRLEERNGATELKVLITRETVEALLAENPWLNNPLVENFGPATTEGLTNRDYLDMMEFVLGEESRRGIQESSLDLFISVEGRVLDQEGGRVVDDRTVRYSIPLLPLLMLKEPIEYSLRYR